MKKKLLLLGGLALSVDAAAIQVSDYMVPESSYQESFMRGQFSSKGGNQDQISYDYNAGVNYLYNYTSLKRNFRFSIDGNADGSQGPTEGDEATDNILGNAEIRYDNYFKDTTKFFWYGAGDVNYKDEADNLFSKIGLGVGYGRVINATPLARAIRMVEELQEHSLVNSNVTDPTFLKLAEIVSRESEYRAKHGEEEYKAIWFKDMESALREGGAISTPTLGAVAVLHMERVLIDENISVRKHGWFLRTGVGYIITDFNGEAGDPSADIEFEYALPIGLRAQFTENLKVSFVLGENNGYVLNNAMSYTYEISDAIDWENSLFTIYTQTKDDNDDKSENLKNTLATTFRYYLTNQLNVDATLSATHFEDYLDNNDNDRIDLATSVGVRYRLR